LLPVDPAEILSKAVDYIFGSRGLDLGATLLMTSEASTGIVSKSEAIFSGSAMEKKMKVFRRSFTKKYRSKN